MLVWLPSSSVSVMPSQENRCAAVWSAFAAPPSRAAHWLRAASMALSSSWVRLPLTSLTAARTASRAAPVGSAGRLVSLGGAAVGRHGQHQHAVSGAGDANELAL